VVKDVPDFALVVGIRAESWLDVCMWKRIDFDGEEGLVCVGCAAGYTRRWVRGYRSSESPFTRPAGSVRRIGWEIREAIDRVCESQRFILGPEVAALEEEIATFCGARFAIGVSSGNRCAPVSLDGCGYWPGDEVIVPPYSFFARRG